jgi:hypothetical protein
MIKKVTEVEEVVLPVCPYCKTEMRPQYFNGYYERFPMWACACSEIPDAEQINGCYAY